MTKPSYDFEKLLSANRRNLLGRFIESFQGEEQSEVGQMALYEGVQAILGDEERVIVKQKREEGDVKRDEVRETRIMELWEIPKQKY